MHRKKRNVENRTEARRAGFSIAVVSVAALILAAIIALSQRAPSSARPAESAQGSAAKPQTERIASAPAQPSVDAPPPSAAPPLHLDQSARVPAEILSVFPEVNPELKGLVASLLHPERLQGTSPEERALQWRANLQALVAKGADAVPAIAEFLRQNQDYDFGAFGAELGHSSARRALLDALQAIGGPEAVGAMSDVLRSTLHPAEIGILARHLEALAPGDYRDSIVDSARASLNSARAGALGTLDMAPVFEVLKMFGDAGLVPELEDAAKRWNYYAAVALAQLPEGAGVPSLIRMAEGGPNAPGSRLNALEMLAAMAREHPDARDALLRQVGENKIPPNYWPYLVPFLAGEQYQFSESYLSSHYPAQPADRFKSSHIRASNQNFYTIPGPGLAPDQIERTEAFLQEMMRANLHQNPAGIKAMQDAQNRLARHREQMLAAP
jgi:hypothetical protein